MRARKRACYDFFLSQLLDDLTCDKGDRAIKRFAMNGFALTGNSYLQHVNSNFFGPLYNPLKWIVKSRSDIIYGAGGKHRSSSAFLFVSISPFSVDPAGLGRRPRLADLCPS